VRGRHLPRAESSQPLAIQFRITLTYAALIAAMPDPQAASRRFERIDSGGGELFIV